MTSTTAPAKKEHTNGSSSSENQKGVSNHKKAAHHHEQAAKHHQEAAKHHEAGDHDRAYESTLKAHGHNSLANEAQHEDLRHHAQSN